MALIEIEGCVLRSMDYRESDRILSLLTGDRGRVDVIARNAKTSYRRFGGHIELFNHVTVSVDYKEERNLHSLRNAKAVSSFPGIRADLLRFAMASYVGEVALRSAISGEPDGALFQTVLSLLTHLDVAPPQSEEPLLRMAETQILLLRGVLPDYSRCGVCGKPLDEIDGPVWRSFPDGAITCDRCRAAVGRLERVDASVLSALALMRSTSFTQWDHLDISLVDLRASGVILRDMTQALLGSEIKSADFLEKMLLPLP